MISKIHWSWRQFRDVIIIWSFLAGLETTILWGPSQLSTPIYSQSLFASMLPRTDWVVALKLSLSPGAGNPRYSTGGMGQFGAAVTATPFRRRTFRRWNVKCGFLGWMSPKCKSSHCRREACRRKIRSSTCPRPFQSCCIYCDSWCIPWIWKCHYCIFVHR